MTLLSGISSFCRSLFRRARAEKELHEELNAYLQLLIAENLQAGMEREQAVRAARLQLGGMDQVKEQVRDVRVGVLMETLFQDLRYAIRTLTRNPGFTTVAVLALALGIGANTAIFSVVYGVLLRPLPYAAADRLAMVYVHFSPQNTEHGTMSIADYLDWKAQNHAFEDPALYSHSGWRFDITGTGEPEEVLGNTVTANFFDVFRAKPLLGRVFQPDESAGTSPPVVVLSESLWRRRFDADTNIGGRAIKLNGVSFSIIGVMPATFRFPADSELWVNLRITPPTRRGPFPFIGLGRLKPGVSLEQAQAETNAIGRRIEQANPKSYSHLTLPVLGLREALVGSARPALLVIFGAVVFVLLIATVNVANLVLARATTREREIAVRLSLGAGRGRLLRQLLTESILLALLGGLTGLLLAYAGIHVLRAWNPGNLPRIEEIRLDSRILGFTFAISVLTGILCGLAPALQSSRAELNASLKDGGRGGTAIAARQRTRAVLVISEVALSVMLLIGAGLLLRSFLLLQQVNAGFDATPQQILTMAISISGPKYTNQRDGISFYQRLLERVRSLPGVASATISDGLPPDRRWDYDTFEIQGQTWTEAGNPAVTVVVSSPDYFKALGIPLLTGRHFTGRDAADSPAVTIISESMARRFFGGRDPVGQHMKEGGLDLKNDWMEIIGVVGDVKYTGLDSTFEPAYYQPYTQSFYQRMHLVVRSAIAANMAPALRAEVHAIDKDATVTEVATMEEALSASVAQPHFRTVVIGAFALLALSLAAIGIYGVIAYSVSQRTQEIGIRMALGARQMDVLRLVVGNGLVLGASGIALGVPAALALTQLISGLLFSVRATDPLTFAAVSILLMSVTLFASLVPARRATRIHPLTALRHE